jgi:hypothetical protein
VKLTATCAGGFALTGGGKLGRRDNSLVGSERGIGLGGIGSVVKR